MNLCLRPTTPDQHGKGALPLYPCTSAFAQPGDQVTQRGTVRIVLGTPDPWARPGEDSVYTSPMYIAIPPDSTYGRPTPHWVVPQPKYDPSQPEALALKGTLPIHYLGSDDPRRLSMGVD